MELQIELRKLRNVFILVILALLLANLAGVVLKHIFDYEYAMGLVPLFDFNTEQNIPTLFSSLLLLLASLSSLLMVAVTLQEDRISYAWIGMFLLFLFLSIDESAAIHERLGAVRNLFGESAGFSKVWLSYYLAAAVIISAFYAQFVFKLPAQTRNLLLVSAACYLGGAAGVELLGARYAASHGSEGVIYALFYSVEETLEMLGIVLYVYTVLSYLVTSKGRVNIGLTGGN